MSVPNPSTPVPPPVAPELIVGQPIALRPRGRTPRLFNRNWFLLWQGQTVSRFGNIAFDVSMGLWIYDAFGSAFVMGAALALTNLPGILLEPLGGAVADRFSRRRVIILCDLLSGLLVLGLAAILLLVPGERDLKLGALIVVSSLLTVIGSFFAPAIGAALPDLVPPGALHKANVMGQLSQQGTGLLGQSFGPALYQIIGAPWLMLFNGISFLFASGSETLMKLPDHRAAAPPQVGQRFAAFRRDILEGVQYVWHDRPLRSFLGLTVGMQFFGAPVMLLLVFYVQEVLGLSKAWVGFMGAAAGVGVILGSVLVLRLRLDARSRPRLVIACQALGAASTVALGLNRMPVAALILAGLTGFASGVGGVITQTVLQQRTPVGMRGRVLGLLGTVASILTALALAAGGGVTDLLDRNIPVFYVGSGIIMLTLVGAMAASRHFRSFLAFEPPAG